LLRGSTSKHNTTEPSTRQPSTSQPSTSQPNTATGVSGLLEPVCGQPGLSGHDDPGLVPPPAARGIAAQVVANTSLLIAVLVYMGWAYDNALYGYFRLSPLDLDIGIVEYMLRSLSLFSSGLVIVAVVIVAVTAVRTWGLTIFNSGGYRVWSSGAGRAMPEV
jgi:hypothetical protein